jgi:hypothetical protein
MTPSIGSRAGWLLAEVAAAWNDVNARLEAVASRSTPKWMVCAARSRQRGVRRFAVEVFRETRTAKPSPHQIN